MLVNNDVPVSLSCDDPQFFGISPFALEPFDSLTCCPSGNYGLSYDFYQVFAASEQMSIIGLGKLARQSIDVRMRWLHTAPEAYVSLFCCSSIRS